MFKMSAAFLPQRGDFYYALLGARVLPNDDIVSTFKAYSIWVVPLEDNTPIHSL